MDAMGIIILSAVVLVIVVLGIVLTLKEAKSKKRKRGPDYYAIFIMGVIWLIIGVPLNNAPLWGLGLIFFIVGIMNKNEWKKNRVKWKDLGEKEKQMRIWIMIFLGIVLLAGFILLIVLSSKASINGYAVLVTDSLKPIIEKSDCLEKGKLTDRSFYNENTNTWWIDLDMKKEFEKSFCNPACVVNLETTTAEINYRCTGALTCQDNCGNDVCEEIVCQAEGCPCAETLENCPEDCN